MSKFRVRVLAIVCGLGVGLVPALALDTSAPALSNPTLPYLTLNRTISSQPWSGSATRAFDLDGATYLPYDGSFWIVDDGGNRAYEVDRVTGQLRRTIAQAAFATALPLGGGAAAGVGRADAFQSAAYDVFTDSLYIFSANCCGVAPFQPTAFRLKRDGAGKFQVESYQALPEGTNPAAAGYRYGTGLYFGKGTKIRTYNYATNTIGPDISIIGAGTSITGMDFPDANTLLLTTTQNQLVKVSTTDWTVVSGWTFDLGRYGILNPRSVDVLGDQIFIADGYDLRPATDPLKYAVFVLDLSQTPPPVASFAPHVTRGASPLAVWFIDHSIRAETHLWNFGDGAPTSTEVSPAHIYTTPGTYTATLKVTSIGGTSNASKVITVLPGTARTGGFTLDGFGGLHPFKIGTNPTAPATHGAVYWPGWDIARGAATLPDGSGGYTLDGFGGLHPFRIGAGTTPPPTKNNTYWPGFDIARGVALMPNGNGGLVVDAYGGIHRFRIGAGLLPGRPHGSPYWLGQDMAQGITILPDGSGGYVIDRTGSLHAFTIGTNPAPPSPTNVWAAPASRPARGVSLLSTGIGGYTIDGNGGVHRFAITAMPPTTSGVTTWPGWDIVRDVVVLPAN